MAGFLNQDRHLRIAQQARLAEIPFHTLRKLLRSHVLCLHGLAKQREGNCARGAHRTLAGHVRHVVNIDIEDVLRANEVVVAEAGRD